MGSFAFAKEFLPIVKGGDYVQFLPVGSSNGKAPFGGVHKINQVEVIPQYIIDLLQVSGALPFGVFTIASGGQSNSLSPALTDFKNLFAVDKGLFAQYRFELTDDFLLSMSNPGSTNYIGATEYGLPLWSKRLPSHKAPAVQFTGATALGTPTIAWTNTNGTLVGAQISNQYPVRKARIVGLAIYVSAAMTIYFKDTTSIAATIIGSQDFAIPFTGKDFIFLGRDSIPDDLYFDTGIAVETDTAALASVEVIVEEDNVGIFDAELKDSLLAKGNQSNEFFVWEENMPSMKVWNPLSVAISRAKMVVAGYLFSSTPLPSPPSGTIPVGIPLYRIPRGGTPSA